MKDGDDKYFEEFDQETREFLEDINKMLQDEDAEHPELSDEAIDKLADQIIEDMIRQPKFNGSNYRVARDFKKHGHLQQVSESIRMVAGVCRTCNCWNKIDAMEGKCFWDVHDPIYNHETKPWYYRCPQYQANTKYQSEMEIIKESLKDKREMSLLRDRVTKGRK